MKQIHHAIFLPLRETQCLELLQMGKLPPTGSKRINAME